MDRKFGMYVFIALAIGALFGMALGAPGGNGLAGAGIGALVGVFIGWFMGATALRDGDGKKKGQ